MFNVNEAIDGIIDDINDDYYSESFTKSPLKKFLAKLKVIKNEKPGEYAGDKEIKEFVDKNYDKIEECCELLQEEPKKLQKDEVAYLTSWCISFIGMIIGCCSGPFGIGLAIGVVSYFFMIISMIVWAIIRNARANNDINAMRDLSKIKVALKKLNTKKLPDKYKKKISNLIQEIDDAETDIYTKFKKVAESTYDEIYDELCYRVECGELSLDDAEVINETAYDRYISETYAEFDPEEFSIAYEYAVDYMEDVMYESSTAYKKYMSEDKYQKLIEDAVSKDDDNVPPEFESDPKFVKEFKNDFKKAKSTSNKIKKKGIGKKAAITAAAMAAIGAGSYAGYHFVKGDSTNGGASNAKEAVKRKLHPVASSIKKMTGDHSNAKKVNAKYDKDLMRRYAKEIKYSTDLDGKLFPNE